MPTIFSLYLRSFNTINALQMICESRYLQLPSGNLSKITELAVKFAFIEFQIPIYIDS